MTAYSNPQASILLVEDDADLAGLIQDYLRKNGFSVNLISDGLEALKAIPVQQPDLVILDIMLPGMSGMDVCRNLRPHYNGLILMLTALDEDMDQMLGLELGADDYVIKPVQPRLLLTRIRTLLRRLEKGTQSQSPQLQIATESVQVVKAGQVTIDSGKRQVHYNDQIIDLTTAEFELLLLLAQHIGQPVSREVIMQQLRGFDYDGLDRSMDRRISRLRKKLQVASLSQSTIKTVRGKGYQLCTE